MQKINSFTKLFALFIATAVIISMWATSVNAQVQLTERSKLAINGIGPIRVRMTVDEASQSAGVKLVFVANGPDAYIAFLTKMRYHVTDTHKGQTEKTRTIY